jgi:hypothetical protein
MANACKQPKNGGSPAWEFGARLTARGRKINLSLHVTQGLEIELGYFGYTTQRKKYWYEIWYIRLL